MAGDALRLVVRREDDGQSLIEFAVTLPVLMVIVTGLLTFGIAINNDIQLTDATGVGARTLALSRGSTDPCATVASAVSGAAAGLKAANISYTTTINGTAYTGSSCTGAAATLSSASGATVTVLATYPCSLKFYKNNSFPTCNLTAQTSELVQ